MEKETALKILRKHHDQALFSERTALETLIPELKESEDERIMKNIITFLDELFSLGKNANFDKWSKSDCAEWIAWIEKQGESYTKKDVDDAWLKGICDAKQELEKQYETPPIHSNSSNIGKDEQNPVWSEEDKEQLDRAIYMMEQLDMTKSWDDVYNWLKSLKDRLKGE